jgi:hypothetical protein
MATLHTFTTDCLVYGGGVLASAGYAYVLDRLEQRFPVNPDWTILEVAGGTILCFGVGSLRMALAHQANQPTTAWDGIGSVAHAFLWASLPVALWQGWRMHERHHQTRRELTHVTEYPTD